MKKRLSGILLCLFLFSFFLLPCGSARAAGTAPVITGAGDNKTYTSGSLNNVDAPTAWVGKSYSLQMKATGSTPITWIDGMGGLEAYGLSIDPNTGLISGTPTKSVSGRVLIQAKNSAGSDSVWLQLRSYAEADRPVITTEALSDGMVGWSYYQEVSYTGRAGQPNRWSVASGTLPKGLTMTSDRCVIKGTPTQSGTFTFTLQLNNGVDIAQKIFTIYISEDTFEPPKITTEKLPSAFAGEYYYYQLEASGTQPITWSLYSAESLPSGLAFDSKTGTISGQLLSSTETFSVTYRASNTAPNGSGREDTRSLTLNIYSRPAFDDNIFANGCLEENYDSEIIIKNWFSKMELSVSKGKLPEGLELANYSGELHLKGTPAKAGTYTFTLKIVYEPEKGMKTETEKSFTVKILGSGECYQTVEITGQDLKAGMNTSAFSAESITSVKIDGARVSYSCSDCYIAMDSYDVRSLGTLTHGKLLVVTVLSQRPADSIEPYVEKMGMDTVVTYNGRPAEWLCTEDGETYIMAEYRLIMGDVNVDNTLNLKDVSELFRWWNGKSTLTAPKINIGDYNGDGITDLRDAAEMYRVINETEIQTVTVTVPEFREDGIPTYTAECPFGAHYFSDTYTNGSNYKNDMAWFVKVAGGWSAFNINSPNAFEKGKEYKLELYLTAKSGCKFDFDRISATVNGTPAEVSRYDEQLVVEWVGTL